MRAENSLGEKREPSGETLQTDVTYFKKSLGPALLVPNQTTNDLQLVNWLTNSHLGNTNRVHYLH